ncbi:N-hydroxyarylamine O-acetyltransferase [Pseudodesulfovibrio nedwellii]|uniref:N-hydroxyarylamine O-acetyltransferase n=1 Tax=Pseudodesulfovibrio nedwellii TaxID=2973072 RepID=A0ABM8B2M0_9BACT|nr:arylamine N-acetyltransferase [Pseudodesulfovibrio nedwellii]BDQ37867.1 N-hydroxyarylamine O-acetyltransferase [Pseudodesulfovibrio nedwellii]
MKVFEFDSTAYLQRLHFSEKVLPTTEGLHTLQRAQFHNIPFENFDIQLGRGVDLDPANLFDKLVRRPRGGYCLELNGLLLMALRAFGFDARPLLARVHLSGQPSGRGHQLSLVNVEGRQWLVDVGFGKNNPRGPYLLERDTIQDISGKYIRLVDGGVFGNMLQARSEEGWQNLYSFDMEHVCQGDINYGAHYTSTNSNSFFTTSRVAMKPLEDGMVTLFNNRLTLFRDGQENEIQLPEGQEYMDALKTYFGIELDAPYEALRSVDRE